MNDEETLSEIRHNTAEKLFVPTLVGGGAVALKLSDNAARAN
jgi:hypothetical protein